MLLAQQKCTILVRVKNHAPGAEGMAAAAGNACCVAPVKCKMDSQLRSLGTLKAPQTHLEL